MTVVFARGEAARNHLAPQLPNQRLTEQVAGGRVGLAHLAMTINHDHTTGQQVEQVLQTVGQTLLFIQFRHALGADHCQLTLEFGDPRLEQGVGLAELSGNLIEQGDGVVESGSAVLLDRNSP